MKLVDYEHEDQLYFLQAFLNKCNKIVNKFNKSKSKSENVTINQFYLSQMINND